MRKHLPFALLIALAAVGVALIIGLLWVGHQHDAATADADRSFWKNMAEADRYLDMIKKSGAPPTLADRIDSLMSKVQEEKDELLESNMFYARALCQLMERTGMQDFCYQADWVPRSYSYYMHDPDIDFERGNMTRFVWVPFFRRPEVMFSTESPGRKAPAPRINLQWVSTNITEMWPDPEPSAVDFPLGTTPPRHDRHR